MSVELHLYETSEVQLAPRLCAPLGNTRLQPGSSSRPDHRGQEALPEQKLESTLYLQKDQRQGKKLSREVPKARGQRTKETVYSLLVVSFSK